MNRFLYPLLFILLPVLAYAQTARTAAVANTAEKPISNAEKFSQRSGTLVEKTYIDIGKIKGCEIQVVMYKDLMTNQKTSAVRFEYEYSGAYNISDTKLALLDADEIDGLIKSIQILQEKMIASKPVNYTEVEYFSRSGFQAGGFYEQKKKAWSAFVKLEKYDSKSYVFIDNDDLTQLLTLIIQAKTKLQA